MEGTSPVVNNLKVHFLLDHSCIHHVTEVLRSREDTVCYNNYFVVKNRFSFIIFPKSGFVNITGIKSFSHLPEVIPHFCKLFPHVGEKNIASEIVIDNISAAGNFGQRVDLVCLQHTVNRSKERGGAREKTCFTVHFDRNFFPGAFCRTRGFGTLTVFPSGKYVVVGAKCLEHVDKVVQQMLVIISTLSTTKGMEKLSAPTAGKSWSSCLPKKVGGIEMMS